MTLERYRPFMQHAWEAWQDGESLVDLVAYYGITYRTIRGILRGYAQEHNLPFTRPPREREQKAIHPHKEARPPVKRERERHARGVRDPVRAQRMYDLRIKGVTLREIGEQYGMTREGVRVVVKRYEQEYALPAHQAVQRETRRQARRQAQEQEGEKRRENARQRRLERSAADIVLEVQLDAHLVGRFLHAIGDRALYYRTYAHYHPHKDGSYALHGGSDSIQFRDNEGTVWKLKAWVLAQLGIERRIHQGIRHKDGDVLNNMRENLELIEPIRKKKE